MFCLILHNNSGPDHLELLGSLSLNWPHSVWVSFGHSLGSPSYCKCTSKAESRAAGCNNICHNYPENINITAPGSAELPVQFCCVCWFVICRWWWYRNPVLRSWCGQAKFAKNIRWFFCLVLDSHTKFLNVFVMIWKLFFFHIEGSTSRTSMCSGSTWNE